MTSVRSELVPVPPGESVMCDALCAQVASDRVPGHRAVWFTSAFPLAVRTSTIDGSLGLCRELDCTRVERPLLRVVYTRSTLTWHLVYALTAHPCQSIYPPRRSTGCKKRVVTQLHRPGRPGPPRPRNVQARKPKRPRRAPPPSLDEPALGRPGRSGALYTACNGFNFALQTPIYTRCAPAATPRLSHATPAGPPALVAQTPRFATKTPT